MYFLLLSFVVMTMCQAAEKPRHQNRAKKEAEAKKKKKKAKKDGQTRVRVRHKRGKGYDNLLAHVDRNTQEYTVTQICEEPRIFHLENFLSQEECEHLINLAKPNLVRSRVVGDKAGENRVDEARTSRGAFLATGDDEIMNRIEKRIAKLTKIPVENGEEFHVLHYKYKQQYLPHFDYFWGTPESVKACTARGGQREASVVMYLYDTEEGGETIFPRAKKSVAPVRGDAVLFYNLLPNGECDPMSLHGGAPILKGEKWIATKWLRQGRFR